MEPSINDKRKRRGRPATGLDPMIGFRSPPELTNAIDKAAGEIAVPRSEMIRRMVTDWLRERGYLPKSDPR